MGQRFQDLKYERPDFDYLSSLQRKMMRQLTNRKLEFADFEDNFKSYSDYYLYCLSMYHLYKLKLAKDEDAELSQLELGIAKAQREYLSLFTRIADAKLISPGDSLEKLSLLNQARRIARTYGKISFDLIDEEARLMKQYKDFYKSVNITLTNKKNKLEKSSSIEKTSNINISDFLIWLRQANGETRTRVYYKFSQELQKYDHDNVKLYQELVDNRKKQAKQSQMSYFDFVIARNKGFGYQRKDLLAFKQDIIQYFFPLIDEVRRLRDQRFKQESSIFYDAFKFFDLNPINLLQTNLNVKTTILQALQEIFKDNEPYISEIIQKGYWDSSPELNRKIGKQVTLLPHWNKLFLSLKFDQDYFNLEDLFFSVGKALSDLSGMINLQGVTSYEQSPLIRQVSGFAMIFLSMKQSHMFTEFDELFNDLTLINLLMHIPYALAMDTFESNMYAESSSTTLSYSSLWQQIEKNNNLDYDFASDGYFSVGNSWQIMPSLFLKPFSSLEYVLALIVILAENPYRDRRNSLEKKLNQLLTTNTELDFAKRLEICGFSLPFDLTTIRKASFAVCDMLQI